MRTEVVARISVLERSAPDCGGRERCESANLGILDAEARPGWACSIGDKRGLGGVAETSAAAIRRQHEVVFSLWLHGCNPPDFTLYTGKMDLNPTAMACGPFHWACSARRLIASSPRVGAHCNFRLPALEGALLQFGRAARATGAAGLTCRSQFLQYSEITPSGIKVHRNFNR